MDYLIEYQRWKKDAVADEDIAAELAAMSENEDKIKDAFYKDLEFGTGGLRGVIGAGTNRMNIYTVSKTTQGICKYLNDKYENPSVAISYDSRNKSEDFARRAACVFAANGISVYLYPQLMPTPLLSYAVRYLACQAGAMVTASHNPAKYNGYKVYGSDGCQMTLEAAEEVYRNIESIDIFEGVKAGDFDRLFSEGKIQYIGLDLVNSYFDLTLKQQQNPGICKKVGLKVVYTPLNGTGNRPVRHILKSLGVSCSVVKEQENPDGNFTTCTYPNPEEKAALTLALQLADREKPDLVLATDPDCDRVGIAAPNPDGSYRLFTGNETGVLLLDYLLSQRVQKGTMPADPVVVTTIVTTPMVHKVAEKYHAQVIDVLTGFKFIGEQIGFLEEQGKESNYIFGFEESYGYLAGTHVRDKDGVVASMLICEMTAYYKDKGISLVGALENLYRTYGYYLNGIGNFAYEGADGAAQMKAIMARIRSNMPKQLGNYQIVRAADYLASAEYDFSTGAQKTLTLPKSDVLVFTLENNSQFIIRPSGTEPKLKVYMTACGKEKEHAQRIIDEIGAQVKNLLK